MRWDLIIAVVGGAAGAVVAMMIRALHDDIKREGGLRAWAYRGRLNAIYHNMKMCPNCKTGDAFDVFDIQSCPKHRAEIETMMKRMRLTR